MNWMRRILISSVRQSEIICRLRYVQEKQFHAKPGSGWKGRFQVPRNSVLNTQPCPAPSSRKRNVFKNGSRENESEKRHWIENVMSGLSDSFDEVAGFACLVPPIRPQVDAQPPLGSSGGNCFLRAGAF